MQIKGNELLHLTYCTKIHPGHGWQQLFHNIRTFVPELKSRLSPDRPFGLGVRLSAAESEELLSGDNLSNFKDFLDSRDLYVFTLNGFPYGSFHGPSVKSEVFAPDWRQETRVRYTLRLIDILAYLLPVGMEGSISTSPLSYRPWLDTANTEDAMVSLTANLLRVVEKLIQLRQTTGQLIHLDLEPEPDGLVENSLELINYFDSWLLPWGAVSLADRLAVSIAEAERHLLDHIQVCLDTCHMAVVYEDPVLALDAFTLKSIGVGKVQITAGLQAMLPPAPSQRQQLIRELEPFSRSPYLHQVVGRRNGSINTRFPDLIEALPGCGQSIDEEWRIHYHLPLFLENFGLLSSTQDYTRAVLQLLRRRGFTRHLEIETYTWDFLPPQLKLNLLESLTLEYQWVLDELA